MNKSHAYLPALLAGLTLYTLFFFGIGSIPIHSQSYPTATTPASAVYTQGTNFFAGAGILPVANGGTGSTTGTTVLNAYGTSTISAAGTTTLTAMSNVNARNVTISAGSSTYAASIVLSDSGASTGAFWDIYCSIPASSNPTINVYDGSTSGTLLNTVTTNGTAGNTTISYFFNGTAWVRFGKGALLTYQNLADLPSAATARTNLGLGAAATISSTAGGDLSGILPSPTVIGINGTLLSSLATGLHWNTTSTGAATIATANQVASALTGTTGTLNLTASTITVPTATAGDSTNKPASTQFVATSFAPLASPAFTGTPTVPTASAGDSTGKAASTQFVATSFAPLVSPAFLGSPSLPTGTTAITQASTDNSSKLATTAFAQTLIGSAATVPPGFKNRFINGSMRTNQRGGTSITSSTASYIGQDRWYVAQTGASSITLGNTSATTGGANAVYFQNAMLITGASGNTGFTVGQKIESTNIYDLAAASTVTVSFYASSNYLTSLTMTVYAATGGLDNWSSRSAIAVKTFTISGSLTQYQYSFTFSSNYNGCSVEFTAGSLLASDTFTLTGVQLELGAIATAFERTPVDLEFAQCLRYYEQSTYLVSFSGGTYYDASSTIDGTAGTNHYYVWQLHQKRTSTPVFALATGTWSATPTITVSANRIFFSLSSIFYASGSNGAISLTASAEL